MRRVTSYLHATFGVCAASFAIAACGSSDEPSTAEPDVIECPAGQFSNGGSEPSCEPCPEAHYCLGGEAQPIQHRCEAGEYIVDYASDSSNITCKTITTCGDRLTAVTEVPSDGTATEDVRCCDLFDIGDVAYTNPSQIPRRPSGCLWITGSIGLYTSEPFPIEVVHIDYVSIDSYAVTDLRLLGDLRSVHSLLIHGSSIQNLEDLRSDLKVRDEFRVSSSQTFTSLAGLPNLNGIKTLYIRSATRFTDLTLLEHIEEIEYINLSDLAPNLTDLSFLRNLRRVQGIGISNSAIRDFKALGSVEGLTTLNLSFMPSIQDFQGLEGIKNMQTISIRGLPELRSFHGLEDLERLRSLTVIDAPKVTSFYGLDSLYDLQSLTLQNTPDFCTDYLETFLQRFVPRPYLTTNVTDWTVPCR